MRTEYNPHRYPASRAIDGDVYTIAASKPMHAADEWISVEFPVGSNIGFVDVYNREDSTWLANMLNPYEVWLSASSGGIPFGTQQVPNAYQCGADLYAPGLGPYQTWCGGTGNSNLRFVTVIIRAMDTPGAFRLLSIGEIKAFAA